MALSLGFHCVCGSCGASGSDIWRPARDLSMHFTAAGILRGHHVCGKHVAFDGIDKFVSVWHGWQDSFEGVILAQGFGPHPLSARRLGRGAACLKVL